jgi:glycosyltransferase involved in cell wall biosynthesis
VQVTIGIPSQGRWVDQMGLSLIHALYQLPHGTHFVTPRGPYLDVAREVCLTEAITAKSDYLVFIDTDIGFQPDAISRLLAHGKDVIGGNYHEKRHPLTSTVKYDDANDGLRVQKVLPAAPFRCAAVGTGFMAINIARLTACMAPPCFAYFSEGAGFGGEDVAFCRRARAAGLEVWCDPTIPLQHIGDFAY